MENHSKANIEHALKWGIILGMANILLYLLVYLISKSSLTSWWLGTFSLALNIFLLIIPVTIQRKEFGNEITFNEAFLICFITYAGGSLLQTIFTYILYNFIDPGLSEYIKTKAIEMTQSMMEKFGAPQDSIEKTLEKMQLEDFRQTPARIARQFLFMILFGGVISLILAAILKRKPKNTDFAG
ncbi:MAG: DUF4199 domain-containing protein [Bacteroidia bacterium]